MILSLLKMDANLARIAPGPALQRSKVAKIEQTYWECRAELR
jgi:hypothetical protein